MKSEKEEMNYPDVTSMMLTHILQIFFFFNHYFHNFKWLKNTHISLIWDQTFTNLE